MLRISVESEAAEDRSQLSCSLLHFGRARGGCFEFCHRSSGWLFISGWYVLRSYKNKKSNIEFQFLLNFNYFLPSALSVCCGASFLPTFPRTPAGAACLSPAVTDLPHGSVLLPGLAISAPVALPALLTCFSSVSQLYPGQRCPHHRAKAVL